MNFCYKTTKSGKARYNSRMDQVWYVLIGDMIASSKLSPQNREAVQEDLDSLLHALNRDQAYRFPRPKALVTLGDEFQAVFVSLDDLLNALFRIRLSITSVHFRFGIGVGKITTPIKDEALGMDGPAFWHARTALEESHGFQHKNDPLQSNILFRGLTDEKLERLINASLSLCDKTSSRWRMGQRRSIKLILEKHWSKEDIKLKEISNDNAIDISTASRILKSSSYSNFSECLLAICALVDRCFARGEISDVR